MKLEWLFNMSNVLRIFESRCIVYFQDITNLMTKQYNILHIQIIISKKLGIFNYTGSRS